MIIILLIIMIILLLLLIIIMMIKIIIIIIIIIILISAGIQQTMLINILYTALIWSAKNFALPLYRGRYIDIYLKDVIFGAITGSANLNAWKNTSYKVCEGTSLGLHKPLGGTRTGAGIISSTILYR